MTTIDQLYEIAVKRLERGAYDKAEHLLLQILEQLPDNMHAQHALAKIALEQNQHARAVELLGRVSSVVMDNPAVLADLARAYLGTNHPQDALTCLERAAVLSTNNARIQQLFAKIYVSMGQFDKALCHAEHAVRLDPADAKSHEAQGDVFLELQQMQQAIKCYDRSLAIEPDNWQTQANRGVAWMLLGRLEDARKALTFANALSPLQPNVMLKLSLVLIDLGKHNDASLLLEKLQAMAPQNPEILRVCGINGLQRGETKVAVRSFINALSLDENNLEVQCLLAEALQKEGKIENTVTVLNQAIEKNKTNARAYVQKARTQFLLDRWEDGCETIEAMHNHVAPRFKEPVWDGAELHGKTVLLYSEWGLDELNLLVRFAHYAKNKGGKVLVECTSPILPLVETMEPVDGCCLVGEQLPSFDVHVSLERLPGIVKINKHDIDAASYFSAPADLTDKWRERLSAIDQPKIGVMWRKETDVRPNVYRSVPLKNLGPLFDMDRAHFVCLQTAVGKDELSDFPLEEKLLSVGLENSPMDERLACLSCLDLLITPDTLSAQIASAAGLPVWFLLGTVPEWHFGLEGDKSVWHPTARLFRQVKIGEWEGVVEEVRGALERFLIECINRRAI